MSPGLCCSQPASKPGWARADSAPHGSLHQAEAWPMLRQLPEPILGAWGAPELEGEVPGIISEAGLQPSSEGNGAFVCPCV